MRLSLSIALLALLPVLAPRPCSQDEPGLGRMWTFEDPPLQRFEARYGLEPDPAWFGRLRGATLRLVVGRNAATATWVSSDGLILTNQHLLRSVFDELEDGGTLRTDGFLAASRTAERRLPRLSVQQLVFVEDVTARCNEGIAPIPPDLDASQLLAAVTTAADLRRQNERALGQEFRDRHPELRFELARLHEGARIELHAFRVFEDVRLVCIPDESVAGFGGDLDNFAWPRHALDFAFLRVWDDDAPLDTSDRHLRLSATVPSPGDPVFVAGYPSSTQRLSHLAHLEFLRDVRYPLLIELIADRIEVREEALTADPSCPPQPWDTLAAWSNADKTYRGFFAGLLDPARMQRKRLDEAMLRRTVRESAALEPLFGNLWRQAEWLAEERTKLELRHQLHDDGDHPVLRVALSLALAAETDDARQARWWRERARSEHARLMSQGIGMAGRRDFLFQVERATRLLPSDDPWRVDVVRGRSGEAIAALLENDPLLEPAVFEQALEGQLTGHRSEALALARDIAGLYRQKRSEDRRLAELERHLDARLGELLLTVRGGELAPDATGTLRLSDGVVAGYQGTETLLAHRTTFHGLLERNLVFADQPPFGLAATWRGLHGAQLLATTLNLVSTNDIAAGNSGSPLVDRELRLVGVVFDGNAATLANRYVFRDDTSRAISVSSEAILLALREVFGAEALVAELLGD